MSEEQTQEVSSEVSTPEAQTAAPEATSQVATDGVEAAAAEVPAYNPNFKYKVYGEEKEIPEKYRSLVKSAEDEKELRDFFERAEAVPTLKKKNEEYQAKHQTLEQTVNSEYIPQLQQFHGIVHSLRESVERQDFQGVAEAIGLPPDTLLQLAAREAALRQDPTQHKLAQVEREKYLASRTAESQLSSKEERAIQIETQYIDRIMGLTMSRDDVKQYSESFDARLGKPGAFEQEVRQRGDYLYRTGKKADPVEIIENLMKTFPVAASQQAQAQSTAQPSAAPSQVGKPPVIPAVQSGGSSAVPKKKSYASIKEMESDWEKKKRN